MFKIKRLVQFINENNEYNTNITSKNVVSDLCICMLLINPTFLDSILDKGLKSRYSSNSNIFMNDLKNLLFGNNRLSMGIFNDKGVSIKDDETSKLNNIFNETEFDIEKDWNVLINARITARNIQDKLLLDRKLEVDDISQIFWTSPNKDKQYPEDIVIELNNNEQYSFYLNKKLQHSKTIAFNTIIDTLIEEDKNLLYSEEYIDKWNKLTSEFVRITYENSTKEMQKYISKFISPDRILSLTWEEYHKIKHSNPKYKFLGEYIPELDKNILNFQDLISEIWKDSDKFLNNDAVEEWKELKLVLLNSKIIEHLFINSFNKIGNEIIIDDKIDNEIDLDDKYHTVEGNVKMRIVKLITKQLGATERTVYYLNNNGNEFYKIPSLDWFRNNYEELEIKYDLHTELTPSSIDEKNDSNFKIKVLYKDDTLIFMRMFTKFTGGEMSAKLSTKIVLELSDDFNYKTLTKQI